MRALLSKVSGGPDSLVVEETADPRIEDGKVIISVKACGINFPDTLIIEDRYQYKPARPFSPGGEVAGIVESIGKGVSAVKVGDRVIGTAPWGGMAEKMMIEESRCVRIPDQMSFEDASAFLLTFSTSYYGLKDRGNLKPGETVVVLGAGGGIGLASVALAKAMGARVIGAVSSETKAKAAKEAGADDVYIYKSSLGDKQAAREFTDNLKRLTAPGGADVILDPVGGNYAEAALRAIGWAGRFLVVGFPAGIPSIPLNLTLLKSCQIVGVFWGDWLERWPDEFHRSTQELFALCQKAGIRPVISGRVRLEDAAGALKQLASRDVVGKLIVTI